MSDEPDSLDPSLTVFPTLEALVKSYCGKRYQAHLTLITHVLPTARDYIVCLKKIFEIDVIAIPYSACPTTVEWLLDAGYSVTVPDCTENVSRIAFDTISNVALTGKLTLVQEIGGYLAEFSALLGRFPNFLGVVEDTSNGHWRYAAKAAELSYPVISIAKSPIKSMEDIRIGDAVAFSVERTLRQCLAKTLRGKRVLVVGFGSIGRACARSFETRGCHVSVYDNDPIKAMHAWADGFDVGCREKLLSQSDVIVGATGHRSIDDSCIASIKNGAILVSASSKQVEFSFAFKSAVMPRPINNLRQYVNGGRSFYMLADGFPVNFQDNSVIDAVLDPIYAELFVCLREIAERRSPPGLRPSWPALHQEVACAWTRAHAGGRSVNRRS